MINDPFSVVYKLAVVPVHVVRFAAHQSRKMAPPNAFVPQIGDRAPMDTFLS
jgi:hypothetical protein